MKQAIHKTLIPTFVISAIVPLLATAYVFADEVDTSFTVSTPLLPNITDYFVDTGNDVTLDVNVAEINALEITLSTSNLVIDLTPRVNTTSFGDDTLNILVGTSNSAGYTLTMSSIYNGNSTTSLIRTEAINNTNPTIDTISAAVSPTTFASSSDAATTNKWGYLLSTTTLDVDKTIYNPILTTNTINASTEAVANHPTSLTFGAKVDNTIPAGDYRTTLRFIAVVNPITYNYNLTFNGDGGTPSLASTSGNDSSVTLPTATYHNAYTTNTSTRYATFAGWSETPNATTPTYTNSFTLNDDTDTTLYAVWNFASNTLQYNALNNFGNINCNTNNNATMIDARTGVSYPIYYIGGACWMTKNLYLPTAVTLYASDSNIENTPYTTPTKTLVSNKSFTEGLITPGNYSSNTSTGGWYNYCVASVGTNCQETLMIDNTYDVCPKGWVLPNGTQASAIMANGSNDYLNAVKTIGFYNEGTFKNTEERWWLSTQTSPYDEMPSTQGDLRFTSSFAYGRTFRSSGNSIRCVRAN